MVLIAHPEDKEKDIPKQKYKDHILNVYERASKSFEEMIRFYNGPEYIKNIMRSALEKACFRHDFGKLDEITQAFFDGRRKKCKIVNHVEAGVQYCLDKFFESYEKKIVKMDWLIAALLIDGHHIGLMADHRENKDSGQNPRSVPIGKIINLESRGSVLSDKRVVSEKYPAYKKKALKDETVGDYVKRFIKKWNKKHVKDINKIEEELKSNTVSEGANTVLFTQPLILRFLMSCLVEGDHWDTARHYKNIVSYAKFDIRASERFEHLLQVYSLFPEGKTESEQKRNAIRRDVFNESISSVDDSFGFYLNEAYPGSGKTAASIALALYMCQRYGLRRMFYVAPFKKILKQNVEEIKKFVVMPGEKPNSIVAEHHHESNYFTKAQEDATLYRLLKIYNTLWESSFICTTAVQFCETIASNKIMKLRKFNNISGSVILIDEFHEIPLEYARQLLKWLKELVDHWGCKVVFLSGTSIKYWNIDLLSKGLEPIKVKPVLSDCTIEKMKKLEKDRVEIIKLYEFFTVETIIDRIKKYPGPRLAIVNTIQNAGLVAHRIRERYGRDKVEHVSTALTPIDRNRVLAKIEERLKNPLDTDWTLVATSCIENGVNFSFRTGFREHRSQMSSVQTSGRVNRDNEYGDPCPVFVFSFCDPNVTINPADNIPSLVLNEMFHEHKVNPEFCSEAIRRELKRKNKDLLEIENYENHLDYEGVNNNFQLIKAGTHSVIAGENAILRVKSGELIPYYEIMNNSVEIHINSKKGEGNIQRIEKEEYDVKNPDLIQSDHHFNIWIGHYDPYFLGYMSQVLFDNGFDIEEIITKNIA